MDEAVALMENQSGYIILDVHSSDQFIAGHIPNAINVPSETIRNEDVVQLFNKNQLIFVYCRSKETSKKLVKLGYTNVVEFGGIFDWKKRNVIGN